MRTSMECYQLNCILSSWVSKLFDYYSIYTVCEFNISLLCEFYNEREYYKKLLTIKGFFNRLQQLLMIQLQKYF